MKDLSDVELLEAYASERSEDAFRELVARHIDLIYSAAIRQLRNSQLAEEATQSAFIALAGKAGRLGPNTVIAGWLHRAVHFAALNLQRGEARRKRWEDEAANMSVPTDSGGAFQEAALGHVDGALAELSENDRGAVILRFLQQRSFQDMAQTLGTSEEAVKKRVSRALERLRRLLTRRGVAVSTIALGAGLSQMPVTAAPATLASTAATLALQGGRARCWHQRSDPEASNCAQSKTGRRRRPRDPCGNRRPAMVATLGQHFRGVHQSHYARNTKDKTRQRHGRRPGQSVEILHRGTGVQ